LDGLPTDSLIKYGQEGDCNAQYLLASRLERGDKVNKDLKLSREWMAAAARCGNKWAQEEMGKHYLSDTTGKSDDSAMYWLEQAAQNGAGYSQSIHGFVLVSLASSEADSAEGYMWAQLGVLNAGEGSEAIRDTLKNMLTPQAVKKGDSMAVSFLIEHLRDTKGDDTAMYINQLATMGWPEGQYRSGMITYNDAPLIHSVFGVSEDSTKLKAVELIRKAADGGYAPAQLKLGRMHYAYQIPFAKPNNDSAAYWLGKAAEQGDAEAEMRLGFMYELGEGVKKNQKEALRLFKLSAAQYYPEGIRSLGYFYWSKDAPKKNPVRAHALLALAKSFFIDVDIIPIGETMRKMNDKEKAESEQLQKEMDDKDRIKTIIAGWVD
jgi:TPR repeat protein